MLTKFFKSKESIFLLINILIIIFQFFLITFFYPQIHEQIPFWFTKNWGLEILSGKNSIFLIPVLSIFITFTSFLILKFSEKYYQYLFFYITAYFITISNIIITYSLTNIIKRTTFSNLFFLDYIGSELLNSLFISFVLSIVLTPYLIKVYEKYGLITDPKKHQHPGMLLKNPSARGGGLVFALSFTITSIITTKVNLQITSIIIAAVLAAIIGILDDISNTSSNKKYKFLGNPVIRLLVLLPIPITLLIVSGISISTLNIPFGDTINLNSVTFDFFDTTLTPITYLLTFIWILWLINLLSWSNGVDGQYSGIVAIAGIIIALLGIRFVNLSEDQLNIAKLAIITAGAALGLVPYTWNPSRIMWGFGATSAGIVLAALSILTSTKISISVLVLLVPFMDGVITIIRRIVNKQNPLKGDRSHLHHLLLQRGWTIKQVALFYWASTLILGTIGYFSSDQDLPLLVLTLGGIVGFLIALLNFKFKI